MQISPYRSRPLKFLELFHQNGISYKYYSISNRNEVAEPAHIALVKENAGQMHNSLENRGLITYDIAILMVHEVKEGLMAIISRWIDENMLQTQVYLMNPVSQKFDLFSQNGINTCVWELQILWHERNAWVNHVLSKNEKPNFKNYCNDIYQEII